MKNPQKGKCSADVHNDFGVGFHSCLRQGIIQRDGKLYCKTHDPVEVEKRDDARNAKWKAESEASDFHRRRKLELWQKGEKYDALKTRMDNLETVLQQLLSFCDKNSEGETDFERAIIEARKILKP